MKLKYVAFQERIMAPFIPLLERIATACEDFFILVHSDWEFFTGEKRRLFNK